MKFPPLLQYMWTHQQQMHSTELFYSRAQLHLRSVMRQCPIAHSEFRGLGTLLLAQPAQDDFGGWSFAVQLEKGWHESCSPLERDL